jgi:hypothetical protein
MAGLGWGLCCLRRDISSVGFSHWSPPCPIISGYVSANLTVSPFLGLLAGSRGRIAYSCALGWLPALTSCALGYRGAVLVSILVRTGGAAWATSNLSGAPCKKSFKSPSLRAAFRSRSRPKSLPMRRFLLVDRPSSCTASAGGSFSVISFGFRCCRARPRPSWGFVAVSKLVRDGRGLRRSSGDRTGNQACARCCSPRSAVRLAARQLTAELPNGPVAVRLGVPHVTRLRQGEVGSVSRDEGVKLL